MSAVREERRRPEIRRACRTVVCGLLCGRSCHAQSCRPAGWAWRAACRAVEQALRYIGRAAIQCSSCGVDVCSAADWNASLGNLFGKSVCRRLEIVRIAFSLAVSTDFSACACLNRLFAWVCANLGVRQG